MVRQAVFNILMSRVEGVRFLDLYAGTGAVGLEALSRGAAGVCWVEQDRRTLATLKRNVAEAGRGASGDPVPAGCRVVADDAVRFLRRTAGREAYDVIYADPPYADGPDGGADPLPELLDAVRAGGVLASEGLFVYESSGGRRAGETALPPGWRARLDRRYGRARVRVFEEGHL
jgi:16S rRNA (guanine966-N2)-methyltransferase